MAQVQPFCASNTPRRPVHESLVKACGTKLPLLSRDSIETTDPSCIRQWDDLVFEKLGFSCESAFQHPDLPRIELPSTHAALEHLVRNPPLHVAIRTEVLRDKVAGLPLVDCSQGLDSDEQRRAYRILGFVAHGYVWGNGDMPIIDQLPRSLAIPLQQLSDKLGLAPLATYASTVLWNCYLKERALGWIPENVIVDFTFTGTWDEEWFYAVSACVEAAGAEAIMALVAAAINLDDADERSVAPNLRLISNSFGDAHKALAHMRTLLLKAFRIDSQLFYWKMRPYFAGWALVKPNGVHYAGVDAGDVTRRYLGISAAQSTLFQCLDELLGIERSTENTKFLERIRPHMPGNHRNVLEQLKDAFGGSIKRAAHAFPALQSRYNVLLEDLAKFRTCHLALARKCAVEEASRPDQKAFGLAETSSQGGGAIGAGGSLLEPFLQSLIDETVEPCISS